MFITHLPHNLRSVFLSVVKYRIRTAITQWKLKLAHIWQKDQKCKESNHCWKPERHSKFCNMCLPRLNRINNYKILYVAYVIKVQKSALNLAFQYDMIE